jgi:hypothetical protein
MRGWLLSAEVQEGLDLAVKLSVKAAAVLTKGPHAQNSPFLLQELLQIFSGFLLQIVAALSRYFSTT